MFDLLIDCLGWLMLLLIQYIILFRVYWKNKDDCPWWLYPFAVFFVIQDVAINISVMSLLMLDLPREWTVTERMKRYKKIDDTDFWRDWYHYHTGVNLCLILNVFDKDGHC